MYSVCCTATKIIFLFRELRGLSPNFHIHVSVSDLYIPRIGTRISCSRTGRSIAGIYKALTGHRHMNVEIGTVPQFLFWEYMFPLFGIGSLQCGIRSREITINGLRR